MFPFVFANDECRKICPFPITEKCRKMFTVVGACLLLSPQGFPWFWGNLSTYTTSYSLSNQPNAQLSDIATPWPMSIYVTSSCIAIFFAAILSKFIGVRLAVLCGIFLQNVGIVSAYFFIGNSTILFTICVGFFIGIGGGCVTTIMMQVVIEWAEHRAGLYISIIRSFMVVGAVLINSFVTYYLNPENKVPEIEIESQKFFSDKAVINKVPMVFVILGVMFFVVQLTGLMMVSERGQNKSKPRKESVRISYKSLDISIDGGIVKGEDDKVDEELSSNTKRLDLSNSSSENSDLSPAQMLRTTKFYTLCVTLTLGSIPYVTVNNYYKSYGQLWINDDYFLTILGNILVAVSVVMVVTFGHLMDRWGVKLCLMAYFGSLPFVILLFYFSPLINQWLFCLFTLLFGGIASPLYSLYAACTSKAFGKTHFPPNYGLITLSSAVFNMVSPIFLEAILEYGWFYLFFLAAVLDTIALILVLGTLKE